MHISLTAVLVRTRTCVGFVVSEAGLSRPIRKSTSLMFSDPWLSSLFIGGQNRRELVFTGVSHHSEKLTAL